MISSWSSTGNARRGGSVCSADSDVRVMLWNEYRMRERFFPPGLSGRRAKGVLYNR